MMRDMTMTPCHNLKGPITKTFFLGYVIGAYIAGYEKHDYMSRLV